MPIEGPVGGKPAWGEGLAGGCWGAGWDGQGSGVERMVSSNMQLARELGGLGLAEMEGCCPWRAVLLFSGPSPPTSLPKITAPVLSARTRSHYP